MNQQITEGKAVISIPTQPKVVSKDMPVFYNPVMKLNRDISILLLNTIEETDLRIADIMAASGIRSIRFIKELKKGKIKEITLNDYSKDSVKLIVNNLNLNKIKKFAIIKESIQKNKEKDSKAKIKITNEDANLFLLNSCGFDYIDIDPFGTPNPFLDSSIKRISRRGILAVTATDTAALAGTYPDACRRKYWAKASRTEIMHEVGVRILIRKVQLIAAQFEKALIPIFSYSKDHYMRVFFKCVKGKTEVDRIIGQHGMLNNAGPMWLGKLWDEKLAANMEKENQEVELAKFLGIIKQESKISTVGFYDIHKLCKKHKLTIPRKELLIRQIKKAGHKVAVTHFNPTGLRTDIEEKKLISIIKKI